MVASEYNQRQVDKGAWLIADLPETWPGRQIASDQGVNSDPFRRAVQCFQAGAGLDPDGKVGPVTLAALARSFQAGDRPTDSEVLLTVGGVTFHNPTRAESRPENQITGGRSHLSHRIAYLWNRYGAAIADQAEQYQIPIRAALAVFATEAGDRAYDPKTGLIIIRFETHVFERKAGRSGTSRKHDGRQSTEWAMLQDAAAIDLEKVFASTSFGLPQIMGFNHLAAGYGNPMDLATRFQGDVCAQVQGFFKFCQAEGLDGFIRREDWRGFTRRYNGPGQVDHYSSVLKQYLAAARELKFK